LTSVKFEKYLSVEFYEVQMAHMPCQLIS